MASFGFIRRDNLVVVLRHPVLIRVAPGGRSWQVPVARPGPDQLDGDGSIFVAAVRRGFGPNKPRVCEKRQVLNLKSDLRLVERGTFKKGRQICFKNITKFRT